MHLAGLLWMKNKGSRMADLSHGLVEEDSTSSEGLSHVCKSASSDVDGQCNPQQMLH